MKYLLLTYHDQTLLRLMSPDQREMLDYACAANNEALHASGYLLAAESVQDHNSAITVQLQNGAVALLDGPHAADTLAGLFLIDARDLNEAIQIASYMPQIRNGPIEVRPVLTAE